MSGGWQGRFPQTIAIGVALALIAAGPLMAQTAPDAEAQPPPDEPRQLTTTQPAEVDPPAARSAPEAAPGGAAPEARAGRLSGLLGSKHDFGSTGLGGHDVCRTCHTPHLVVAAALSLDRRMKTTRPLRPYQGIAVELDGRSLMCLGCHDGTVAPDVYSSPHAATIADQLGNSRWGTTPLRSHPLGVRYPAVDEDLQPRAAVEAAGLKLPNGRIQCTTCHDPHNTHRHAGMLRISDERSRLCLTCHRN